MSPPGSPRHFSLPGGCRRDQAVAQSKKDIGWSSSKKWRCRDVWAWRAEPGQREGWVWHRGGTKVAQGGGTEVAVIHQGRCCPGPGGAWRIQREGKGREGSLPEPRGYLCPGGDQSVPGLWCAGTPCPAHPALPLSPRKHHCTKTLQPKHVAASPL